MEYTAGNLGRIPARVQALRARHASRDRRQWEVREIRRGNFDNVAPNAFSEAFPKPIIANTIDTTARDVAAVLAPLPSINCSASSMLSEKAKAFADKRTKIANGYVEASRLQYQMYQRGADQYNSYGLLVLKVMPNFEERTPVIEVQDSMGAYPVINAFGQTVEFARVVMKPWVDVEADYPAVVAMLKARHGERSCQGNAEVTEYSNKDRTVCYLSGMGNAVLEDYANPLGECPYVCVQRPGLDDEVRGAYDDVVWVQIARHRLQSLLIEGVDKAVRAPLAVPMDVDEVPTGPDALIHTQNGAQSIGRVRLDMPAQGFAAAEQLKMEAREGAMAPEARSGSIDASVITGRGVQQLMAGYSSMIAAMQAGIGFGLREALRKCFKMDESAFPDVEKEIRGNDAGVPYAVKYIPRRDIAGDHTVDIAYGFAAGLDPNRALVFLLQADGAQVISKDYLRRALPVSLNAAEEEKKIAIEQSRSAVIMAFSALAQAIPQMAAAGGDVTQVIAQQAKFIELLGKGMAVESAAQKALEPPKPPEAVAPEQAPPGGGAAASPEGFTANGLPAGLQPGIAAEGPNGRPDLNQLIAGLTGRGEPNLQASVSRMSPAGS